jgi:sugar phosphate isomerase/epimerase
MKLALHSAPLGFFKSGPPHDNTELHKFVRKAASLSFRCLQVGPLGDFSKINGPRLRRVLDDCLMERNVHVGGLYDADKFARAEVEYEKVQTEIGEGIELCASIASKAVSFHPPFFKKKNSQSATILSEAKTLFRELVEKEADEAYSMGIKMAIESFCYPPFIFHGLNDFMSFVSDFPSEKVGVLLEVGHLYQAGFNLYEAVQTFSGRLLDVHVHDATRKGNFREATHLPIGKGDIDFSELIRALRTANYDHWLTIEIRGSEREIVESKRRLETILS